METNFYDYIILGTGLQECIASAHLSFHGSTCLQIDREKSYGSAIRTLKYSELTTLTHKSPIPALLSLDREFSIDLTPKFLLASGAMTQYLADQEIDTLVDFEKVAGNFLYQGGKLHFVPKDEKSSLGSGLISWLQKPYVAKFFWKVRKYSEQRITVSMNDTKIKFKECMKKEFEDFSISGKTSEIIGHAIGLNLTDEYLERHPLETYEKIFVYVKSLVALGSSSPFIYPLYGLSELSQAFSRRAGMLGCVFMLNTPVIKIMDNENRTIEQNLDLQSINDYKTTPMHDDTNDCVSENEKECVSREKQCPINYKYKLLIKDNLNNTTRFIYTNHIISDPSYFPTKTVPAYTILTSILILKGQSPLIPSASAHCIFLATEMNRKNDVFMALLNHDMKVCPSDYSVAIISTVKENENDGEFLIGKIKSKIGNVVDEFIVEREMRYGFEMENIIVNGGVDQSTHFETLYEGIKEMIHKIDKKK